MQKDDVLDALLKAQEWAAMYPLQGEASNRDAMASGDVYQAVTEALKILAAEGWGICEGRTWNDSQKSHR